MQRVGHRIGVGDGWNGAARESRLEEHPGIRRPPQKARGRRQNARVLGLVEIQATGIVPRVQAKRDELDAFERRDVLKDRQLGIRNELKGAGGRTIVPKGVERCDYKGRRRDERNAQDAAAGPVPHAAQAQRDQPAEVLRPARVQPGRLEQQRGDEQQRARAEETGGLPGEERCGGEECGDGAREASTAPSGWQAKAPAPQST
jgi:hypothetical protein